MSDESAVVYDLDGTLVRLAVNWLAAEDDIRGAYEEAGIEAPVHADPWALVEGAKEHGIEAAVEAVLSEREVDGAERSRRLPLADEVPGYDGPVGICSLNCEASVRTALDRHDLTPHVDGVVGRDTVAGQKPDPEPLLEAIDRIGATPEETVFVGDSDSDELTAERAGVAFQWVEERLD